MLENKRVLITGGTGTLGKAILRVAKRDKWGCQFTIYSRDPLKQQQLKKEYPDITCLIGDVTDPLSVNHAIAGHDIVIHAAAMKHVVEAEFAPLLAYEVNVNGSLNVLEACLNHGVETVVGISTDKACAPTNSYGATKMMMERLFQRYAMLPTDTRFVLTRYGNVFGSNGSFIHNWKRCYEENGYVESTLPQMTRFWLSEDAAVELVHTCISKDVFSGTIVVPELNSLSIGEIEEFIIPEDVDIRRIPVRPGEKIHETLITKEERVYRGGYYYQDNTISLIPRYNPRELHYWWHDDGNQTPALHLERDAYTSENSPRWKREDFYNLVGVRSIVE